MGTQITIGLHTARKDHTKSRTHMFYLEGETFQVSCSQYVLQQHASKFVIEIKTKTCFCNTFINATYNCVMHL